MNNNQTKIYLKPKKSFSQNFLWDKNIAQKIVDTLQIEDSDRVIEIGPGKGILTQFLLEKAVNLTAIELDINAAQLIEELFPKEKYPNFKLVQQDFRKFDFAEFESGSAFPDSKVKVIGNIPYSITGDIFFHLFRSSQFIERAVIMIQKEVAQRISAKPRTKDYGILTVITNLLGKGKILFDVPPSCFHPKPKVTSSVIELSFHNEPPENFESLLVLIKAAFGQRRKKLSNALKQFIEMKCKASYEECAKRVQQLDKNYFEIRAEELTVEDFIKLHEAIIR
ncbi:MAG: dimethyladenosine transferase [Ignavibacteria bacterium]|nr:dimethyladenosine transferase [Ignavibacteria bacterium]